MSLLFEPRDANFNEFLHQKYGKAYIQKHKWKYYHLYTLLLKKSLYSNDIWHAISSTALRDLYGRSGARGNEKWVYRLIREDLKSWNVILYHTEQVDVTKRIARYKILDERVLSGYHLVDTVVPRRHAPPKPAPTKYAGIHGMIQQTAKKLRVDYTAALAFIEDAYAQSLSLKDKPIEWKVIQKGKWSAFRNRVVDASIYSRWLWHLYKLDRGAYGFKVDLGNTNRVFYLLTQIPSHLRKFMLLGGRHLVEIDITAAQPLLFTNMVLAYCRQQGITAIPDDVRRWKTLCEEPDPDKNLYPALHSLMVGAQLLLDSHLRFDPVTKKAYRVREYTKLFKAEFFAKIFFDEDKRTQMRRVFAEAFPTVSAAITHFKQGDHRNLSLALQQMEADLVVGTVCARLYAQDIRALPVHDALYVHAEHVETVVDEIKKAFQEINLCVRVKTKNM